MSKRRSFPVDKGDYYRVVLTETLPAELPITFSNDGFYTWIAGRASKVSNETTCLIRNLILEPHKDFRTTIPLKYEVVEGSSKTREISLLHPAIQYKWCGIYEEFRELLIYYCNRSTWSIRAPVRTASHVFVSNYAENANEVRIIAGGVDSETEDGLRRHPGSFFAYRGHKRLHRFFRSEDFLELEQEFPVMWTVDVAQCFGSIYTHSIAWAVKTKRFAKDRLLADRKSFSGALDAAMQSGNWQETNGIPVGPEVSRLFAEVIFQSVDEEARKLLEGQLGGRRFAVRRYVDDYFIFAKTDDDAERIKALVAKELRKYNLVLNESKARTYARPFVTHRSIAISAVKPIVRDYIGTLFEYVVGADKSSTKDETRDGLRTPRNLVPRSAIGSSGLLGRRKILFVERIKAVAAGVGDGYDLIALYVIGAFEKRIREVARAAEIDRAREADYLIALSLSVDLMFFFFSVRPTVEASLRLASGCVFALSFVSRMGLADAEAELEQLVFDGCAAYLSRSSPSPGSDGASVEKLNIVGILGQLRRTKIHWQALRQWILPSNTDEVGYFQLVVGLHYAHIKGDEEAKRELSDLVQKRASVNLDGRKLRESSVLHLILDCLSCPFLDIDVRRKILRDTCRAAHCAVPGSDVEADAMLADFDRNPWFTSWSELDLFRSLERKKAIVAY